MALNIGNGYIDRKNYGKSSKTEANVPTAKAAKTEGGKMYSIGDLKPGLEFKATVSDVNNNTIRLRLSDGQQISARLDAKADFNIGEEITFTVKSNDGSQIDISPQRIQTEVNPTLLRALGAADLPATDTNLEMVKSMMNEQLPIDKSSLQSMHRMILNNPSAPIENLVQMTKFNIPVTPENVQQFENYKNFENQISKELVQLSKELTSNLDSLSAIKLPEAAEAQTASPEVLDPEAAALAGDTPEEAPVMQGTSDNGVGAMLEGLNLKADSETLALLNSLAENTEPAALEDALTHVAEGNVDQAVEYNEMLLDIALDTAAEADTAAVNAEAAERPETVAAAEEPEADASSKGAANAGDKTVTNNPSADDILKPEESLKTDTLPRQEDEPAVKQTTQQPDPNLSEELTPAQRNDLASALKQIGMPQETVNAVAEGNISAKELLGQIKEKFDNDKGSIKQVIDQGLFSNKTYQKVLSNAISKQWFLKPEEVGEEQKVSNLYEKLNRQMKMVADQTANLNTNSSNNIMQLAADTSGNMDFMHHLNQMYAYVQIPVRINGEDKESDLYVFSNKKNLSDKEGEIKALLHLDMDALGAVDAFMKLQDTKLDTKFTLDNDESYKLFEDHIGELVTRLEAKGYNCSVKFELGNEPIDFVEDFMKQGQSVGTSQRLSFDVRA
ncbi:MAG: flagellar hook-length control protein FliK [Lachnospiraceae bacterium]|nr:flagellar hook-length control protein FliK [Lachnospiraceae bacterium]